MLQALAEDEGADPEQHGPDGEAEDQAAAQTADDIPFRLVGRLGDNNPVRCRSLASGSKRAVFPATGSVCPEVVHRVSPLLRADLSNEVQLLIFSGILATLRDQNQVMLKEPPLRQECHSDFDPLIVAGLPVVERDMAELHSVDRERAFSLLRRYDGEQVGANRVQHLADVALAVGDLVTG